MLGWPQVHLLRCPLCTLLFLVGGLRFAFACAQTLAALGLGCFAGLGGWLNAGNAAGGAAATVAGGIASIVVVVGAVSGLAVGGAPDAAVGRQEGLV